MDRVTALSRRFLLFFTIFLAASNTLAFAQAESAPAPRNYVNDFAGVLSDDVERKLNALLTRLEQKTTAEVAVVTIQSLQGESLELYATSLFEKYGIGKRGKDNGVLLLIAMKERKIRIETGYGLEGALPDALCSGIIRNVIVPYFKKGDYANGVVAGTLQIAQLVGREYNYDITADLSNLAVQVPPPARKKASALGNLLYILLLILFLGGRFWLFPFFFGLGGGYWSGGRGHSGGGGFGGGFGGFGGGMSGGGGASGGW